jgi:hypothetical protein
MKRKHSILIAIGFTAFLAASFVVARPAALVGQSASARKSAGHLVVHEWGTFTSIAGHDGEEIEWRPLNGSSDLPSFVYDLNGDGLGVAAGLRSGKVCIKCDLEALVRMETPVIYFYADRETTVSVRVQIMKGKITEWYPQARMIYGSTPSDGIDWGRITVVPGAQENYPIESKPSHYYPARETDAAPLRVCTAKGEQREKFLFYRGVGTFDQPLKARFDNGTIVVRNTAADAIPELIVFENRGGQIGYQVRGSLNRKTSVDRPSVGQPQAALEAELEARLIGQGLYEKEALAMIKTWRDSWFEEGLRVFYIVPRKVTDSILPLTVEPQPTETSRVLVGRIEIITPEMENEIETTLSDSSRDLNDVSEELMLKHGRFAEPVLKDLLEKTNDAELRERIQKVISYAGSNPR